MSMKISVSKEGIAPRGFMLQAIEENKTFAKDSEGKFKQTGTAGTKVTVLTLPALDSVVVKVENLTIEACPITQEQLTERNGNRQFAFVTFEGFQGEAKTRFEGKGIYIDAKATGMKLEETKRQ